jgi:hypothetical protein
MSSAVRKSKATLGLELELTGTQHISWLCSSFSVFSWDKIEEELVKIHALFDHYKEHFQHLHRF